MGGVFQGLVEITTEVEVVTVWILLHGVLGQVLNRPPVLRGGVVEVEHQQR